MEVGETGHEYKSRRELGGKVGAAHGGGSGGGNLSMVGLMVVSTKASGAAVWRQEEGDAPMELWRIKPRGGVAVVNGVSCGEGGT
jgi:hypothetical protein